MRPGRVARFRPLISGRRMKHVKHSLALRACINFRLLGMRRRIEMGGDVEAPVPLKASMMTRIL